MAVRVEDVLSVNVVLIGIELLKDPSEVATWSAAIGREFVFDGTFLEHSPMGPVPGRTARLPRERIVVDTSANRSRVTKEYPTAIDDVTSVARIATQVVSCTTGQALVTSHGFNISMVYSNESGENAVHYLGRRIFVPSAFLLEGWNSIGGYGKLKFQDEVREWTVTLEPRLHSDASNVFLDINLHMPVPGLPTEDEMHDNLKELWMRAHALIEAIDSNVDN